jgi:putative two-component system response regulator
MSYKLLIVDDEPANLRLLERLFSREFCCLTAASGKEAIELLEQHDVAIVITDQRMPEMTGIELLKRTAELRPHMSRLLLTGYTDVEALVEAINCGLIDAYLTKPWSNDDLKLKVAKALERYENNKRSHALEVANDRLGQRLHEMKFGFVHALTETLGAKNESVYEHACRTNELAMAMGAQLGSGDEDSDDLSAGAFLHNLGHLGTPDALLSKTAPLTPEERAIFQAHAERGARILGLIPELRNVSDIVRFSEENFDGSGYPRGLSGEQIPLACRIIRVAAAFDLLISPNGETSGMSHEVARIHLLDRAGREFDPAMVKVLLDLQRINVEEPNQAMQPYEAAQRTF